MEANFTFDEYIANNILVGAKIYHKDGSLHVIEYVKINKSTRQLNVHCVDGSVFLANQDEVFTWEVLNERENKTPNKVKNNKK